MLFIYLFIIDYVIIAIPIHLTLLHPAPPTPSGKHPWSCRWAMTIHSLDTPFPILCITSPWLLSNSQSLLNSSTLHAFPQTLLPSSNHQNALSIHDSVYVLLVCLFYFILLFYFIVQVQLSAFPPHSPPTPPPSPAATPFLSLVHVSFIHAPVVDRYVYFALLLFIVLIFSLNNSL